MCEDFTPQQLVNSTTIIYGPTKTGKTTLIIDLLQSLRHYIPVCYIVSGSEDVKPAYSKYIHGAFVCRNPKQIPQLTQKIWDLQEKQTKVYDLVNDMKLLKIMCNHLDDIEKQKINKAIKQCGEKPSIDQVKNIYKDFIIRNKDHILSTTNSNAFRTVIQYAYLNPKILIIFDDCIAQASKEINQSISKFSFEGRHRHITFILSSQYGAVINKQYRQNAHFSIFCSENIAISVLDLLDIGKAQEKKLLSEIKSIFSDPDRMDMKAVLSNEYGGTIRQYKVNLHDKFAFGCDLVVKLYKKLAEAEERKKQLLYQ